MSSAAGSSTRSALRAALPKSAAPRRNLAPPQSVFSPRSASPAAIIARHYSPAPAYAEPSHPEVDDAAAAYPPPSRARSRSPSRILSQNKHPRERRPPPPPSSPSSYDDLTPSAAQAYLSDLLSLPPAHQFPPALALQILTHRSYRYVHKTPSTPPSPLSATATSFSSLSARQEQEAANPFFTLSSHNARLSYLGRRALESYLAMFVHGQVGGSDELARTGLLRRGTSLDEKLREMRGVVQLGREVGDRWRVGEVMRWDRNPVVERVGAHKIKGQIVTAILGGVFSHFGSPAAHRAFHLHVLPAMTAQLRDPRLIERAMKMQRGVGRETGGGIIVPGK